MKFIVNSSYLLKQLSAINGVITTNPVVPILENFLFEITGGTLTITASDLQTSMMTALEVEAKEDGSIAVPAKILQTIINSGFAGVWRKKSNEQLSPSFSNTLWHIVAKKASHLAPQNAVEHPLPVSSAPERRR